MASGADKSVVAEQPDKQSANRTARDLSSEAALREVHQSSEPIGKANVSADTLPSLQIIDKPAGAVPPSEAVGSGANLQAPPSDEAKTGRYWTDRARVGVGKVTDTGIQTELTARLNGIEAAFVNDPSAAKALVRSWNAELGKLIFQGKVSYPIGQDMAVHTESAYAPPDRSDIGFNSANSGAWKELINRAYTDQSFMGQDLDFALINHVKVANQALEKAKDSGKPITEESVDKILSATDEIGDSGSSHALTRNLVIATAREDVGRAIIKAVPPDRQRSYDDFVKGFDTIYGGARTKSLSTDSSGTPAAELTTASKKAEPPKVDEQERPSEKSARLAPNDLIEADEAGRASTLEARQTFKSAIDSAVEHPEAMNRLLDSIEDPINKDSARHVVETVKSMSAEDRVSFEDSVSKGLREAASLDDHEPHQSSSIGFIGRVGTAVAVLAVAAAAIAAIKAARSAEEERKQISFFGN